MKYVTRGNSSPRNKPKIYFCCHPDDIGILSELSEHIFRTHNCAVYYTEDMTATIPEEEKETVLGINSLFVVPVTRKLLTLPNRAMDSDIPYAMEHHIPVLPIMMEKDLLEIYSQSDKFGELQFLDPNRRDITQISYGEKLKKYLDSVLLCDEIMDRIKTVFKVHIFLSYRKKDRRYANELMRLVHSTPELRDVAVWYDEFLVPGESFKENIEKILADSRLFALLVTPNLLENGNYVMRVEYPAAKTLGMPIVPAEMENTDRNELDRNFDGIPDCMAPHSDEFKNRIIELVYGAEKPQTDDAEHNFLVGLAYLEGIDVEVDRDRAVELITEAAESGYIAAVGKLADMYRHGAATERNLTVAADWLKKKVQLLRKQFGDKLTEETRDILFWANIDCGDCCKEGDNLNGAVTSYNHAKKLIPENPQGNDLRNLAVAFDRFGDVYSESNDFSKSIDCYNKSHNIRKQCCSNAPEDMRDLVLSNYKLGRTYSTYGDKKSALKYYTDGLELSERIQHESELSVDGDLILFYANIGDLLECDGKYADAMRYYEKSLKLSRSLAEETVDEAYWIDLAANYVKIGQICIRNGQNAKARDFYEKAEKISRICATKTESVNSCYCLSQCYMSMGDLCCEENDYSQAKAYYDMAMNLTEDRVTWQVCFKLGRVFYLEGNQERAEWWFGKGFELSGGIKIEKLDENQLNFLMFGHNQLGDMHKSNNCFDEANECYVVALRIAEELVKRTENVYTLRELTVSYIKLGEVAARKDVDEARKYYTKAMKIREKISNTDTTAPAKSDLAMSYYRMSTVSTEAAKREYLTKAMAIYESLCKICPEVEKYRSNYEYFKSLL